MKISVNWVRQFLDFELPAVDELVGRIGSQLGEVEEVVDLSKKYKGIIVAKVVECEKHPNADKLSLCKIDDGGKAKAVERDENDYVQVVCGAPNVRKGLLVAWLPPGSTVPSSFGKDPFVLEAREIRGQKSNGMLASPKELAISDEHDGILEIDKAASPGDDFAKLYKLDDTIIDIENKMFTHRPDCFGALGVAREISGILHKPFKSPDWYEVRPQFPVKEAGLSLEIQNDLPELVPRFSAITMSEVKIGPSPVWLQIALSKVGQKPINNIVDLTNFYMLVTGQPLHAYDYDKVKALSSGDSAKIVVRYPQNGEKLGLLNGKEIEPRSEAIMIATDKQAIGLGGVMGGSETEVDENTKNIILECANFDMYSIRRTSMAHGLFTDAVMRFNKGQSPLQAPAALAKITGDVQKLANGKVASEVIDNHQKLSEIKPVSITAEFINARLGSKLTLAEVKQLLENVEFEAEILQAATLRVSAPFWRTDIEIPEDIVEEVGRLYGYDKLPLVLPKRSIKPAQKDAPLELKAKIRETLAMAGANEVLTYSFVHGNLLEKVGQDKTKAYEIANALSPDLQYYRFGPLASLLDKIHGNIKAGYDEFALFELGKGHNLLHKSDEDNGVPPEFEFLDLVYASKARNGAAYYQARKFLDNLAASFNLTLSYAPISKDPKVPPNAPFDLARSAYVSINETDEFLGLVGEFKPSVKKSLKLPTASAGFSVGWELLGAARGRTAYRPLSKYPKVEQDICLKVASDLSYGELADFVTSELEKIKPPQTTLEISPLDIYQRDDNKAHKQITFRLQIASYEKTLRAAEVNKLLDELAAAAKAKFGADRV